MAGADSTASVACCCWCTAGSGACRTPHRHDFAAESFAAPFPLRRIGHVPSLLPSQQQQLSTAGNNTAAASAAGAHRKAVSRIKARRRVVRVMAGSGRSSLCA